MPSLDHFDLIASFYDRAIPLKHVERLIEVAGLPVSGAVLDAGGGTGRVAQALREMVNHIVIADPSSGMLRQTQSKNGLSPVQSLAEKLAFADEAFDRVIMVDALHHVISQRETAFELWRVLKPGGRIVIEEPDFRRFLVKIIAFVEKVLFMRSHFLEPEAIRALFGEVNSRSQVVDDGFNAWIIIDKPERE